MVGCQNCGPSPELVTDDNRLSDVQCRVGLITNVRSFIDLFNEGKVEIFLMERQD